MSEHASASLGWHGGKALLAANSPHDAVSTPTGQYVEAAARCRTPTATPSPRARTSDTARRATRRLLVPRNAKVRNKPSSTRSTTNATAGARASMHLLAATATRPPETAHDT